MRTNAPPAPPPYAQNKTKHNQQPKKQSLALGLSTVAFDNNPRLSGALPRYLAVPQHLTTATFLNTSLLGKGSPPQTPCFLELTPDVDPLPDARYGEEICAWIRLREGETMTAQEVKDFCRDQIAHYKVPRHIRFVDAFPMTVTGKVQKFLMRASMAQDTAAGSAT